MVKKLCIISAVFIFLSSCNSSSDDKESQDNTADSTGLSNPITIDTLKHPSGIDNSSVISTDTAAMNVENSIKKADSVAKKNN